MDLITLYIAGVSRNLWLEGGLSISRTFGHATATFRLNDREGSFRPVLGQGVWIDEMPFITINGVRYPVDEPAPRRFAGKITDVTEYDKDVNSLWFDVRCSDWSECCNRRLVSTYYENQTLGEIVTAIVTDYLDDENITVTNVDTGPTITDRLTFDYVTVAEAFNRLATLTGYDWYIDTDKDLHFSQFAGNAAPYSITDSSANWIKMRVTRSNADYRNVEIVRTNGGIAGAATHTAKVEDATEITARIAAEGGSGRYERVDDINNIEESASATAVAQGMLDRYGVMPVAVEFETLMPGFAPGQKVTINTTKPYANGTFLIESVDSSEEGMVQFRHRIRAVSNFALGDWKTWFANLSARATNPQPITSSVTVTAPVKYIESAREGIIRAGGEAARALLDVEAEIAALVNLSYTTAGTTSPITIVNQMSASAGALSGLSESERATVESYLADGWALVPAGTTYAEFEASFTVEPGDRFHLETKGVFEAEPDSTATASVDLHPHPLPLGNATFLLGVDVGEGSQPLYVGEAVTNSVPVDVAGIPAWAEGILKEPAIGSSVIIDIKRTTAGGVTESVFGSFPKLTIPPANTDLIKAFDFPADLVLNKGDVLSVDVTQIGSSTPGSGGLVRLVWRPQS